MFRAAEKPQSAYLPPKHVRLIDPKKERLETPVDDRGIVDVNELISLVKATVDSNYEWPINSNEHHFYWPKSNYKHRRARITSKMKKFRELTVSKGYLPIEFHNWMHEVVEPPPVPEVEVMEQRIEAWEIASSLFKKARRAAEEDLHVPYKRLIIARGKGNTLEIINNEYMSEVLFNILADQENEMEKIDSYMPEINFIESVEAAPHQVGKIMGEFVLRKNLWLIPDVIAA